MVLRNDKMVDFGSSKLKMSLLHVVPILTNYNIISRYA